MKYLQKRDLPWSPAGTVWERDEHGHAATEDFGCTLHLMESIGAAMTKYPDWFEKLEKKPKNQAIGMDSLNDTIKGGKAVPYGEIKKCDHVGENVGVDILGLFCRNCKDRKGSMKKRIAATNLVSLKIEKLDEDDLHKEKPKLEKLEEWIAPCDFYVVKDKINELIDYYNKQC